MGLSISGIEMKRVLERYGWYVKREGGRHWIMAHPHTTETIPLERHRSDIAIGTLKDILRRSGLTEEAVRKAK